MDLLKDSNSIQLMLGFYNAFDFETYSRVLYESLNNRDYDTDNELLKTMNVNLKRLTSDKDRLERKMALISNYDFSLLEKKLDDKLPADTEVDVEIHFVFDGINGGSIVGDNKMMMNTMLWPSRLEYLELVEGILLHEYHHIGLLYWLRKHDDSFDSCDNGIASAKYLMLSIMSEGAATYFYNDGDDLYPLIIESHGDEVATSIRDAMQNRGKHIDRYMKNLQKDLIHMMQNSLDEEALRAIRKRYSIGTAEPLDKTIGYHMCSSIVENNGLDVMLECFKDPSIFIEEYNKSNRDTATCFGVDFIQEWEKLF